MHCPICTQVLEGGELVMVCTTCHKTLGGAGLDVGSTGEFRVPTPEDLVSAAEDAAKPGESPDAKETCSWCLKAEADVKKLIGRSGTALCNECVSLACDIMDAELGNNWR